MNKIRIILIIIMGVVIVSCADTWGTDPNAETSPVNPGDPVSSGPAFKVDSTRLHFFEVTSSESIYFWNNNINVKRLNTKIDSSDQDVFFWIDMDIENTSPDYIFRNRIDRVTSFRLKIDSLKIDSFILLNNNSYGHWAEIILKKLGKDLKYSYSGSDVPILVNVESVTAYDFMSTNMLLCNISVKLSQLGQFETILFEGAIEIFYSESDKEE